MRSKHKEKKEVQDAGRIPLESEYQTEMRDSLRQERTPGYCKEGKSSFFLKSVSRLIKTDALSPRHNGQQRESYNPSSRKRRENTAPGHRDIHADQLRAVNRDRNEESERPISAPGPSSPSSIITQDKDLALEQGHRLGRIQEGFNREQHDGQGNGAASMIGFSQILTRGQMIPMHS